MVKIRKIETAEESERKRKRNSLILSIIMILILVFSSAGYFTLRENEDSTANQKVENIGDSWIIHYGQQTIRVGSSPESAQNTSILSMKTIDYYAGKTIYVSSEKDAAYYEIASAIGGYAGRIQQACYGKCDKNLPEKDCNETMIVIKESDEDKIYEKDNCVFIDGGMDAVDAFIYKIFGAI